MLNIDSIIYVYLLSLIPIIEGRYALIYGIESNLGLVDSFLVTFLGTLSLSLILPTIVMLIDKMGQSFAQSKTLIIKKIGKIYVSYLHKLENKGKLVEEYGFWGLVAFITIPLPVTGMWSGSLIALLLGLRGRKLVLALFLGGLFADIVTCCSVYFGKQIL